MFNIIPITSFPPHTHAIEVVQGEFEGMIFVYGKIEFLGEDSQGNGRFMFDHTIIKDPDNGRMPDFSPKSNKIAEQILQDIMNQSASIVEQEALERDQSDAIDYASQFPSDPVMYIDENTTVEIEELPIEG